MSLRERRRRLDDDLASSPRLRRFLSPTTYGLERVLAPALRRSTRGRFLDAGCGHQPYRPLVEPLADEYRSLDIEARVEGVDYIADLADLSQIDDDRFDTILSSEVLEHVPETDRALAELARVLAPGGLLVLSVPFLARLHEEPHDYYRFTRHGLRRILARAGLEPVSIETTGSVVSFLGHQVSTALLSATWGIPVLGKATFALNGAFVTVPANLIDRVLRLGGVFPLGYVVVARHASDQAAGPDGQSARSSTVPTKNVNGS